MVFKWSYLSYNGGDNAPTRHHVLSNKNPRIKNELHLFEALAKRGPLQHHSHTLQPMLLVTLHNLTVRPHCWKHIPMSSNIEKRASTQLIASLLLTSARGAQRHYTCFQKREAVIIFTQVQTLQATISTCLKIYTNAITAQMLHE